MFITFEGPDGCGKTTITKILNMCFESIGINSFFFKEPGGNVFADKVREIILKTPLDITTQIYTFAALRSSNKETILSNEQNNIITVADRYIDSSYVYQGLYFDSMELFDLVKYVNEPIIVEPSLTFIVECKQENAKKRMSSRLKDIFEAKLNYNKVSESYSILPFLFRKREYCFINSDFTLEETMAEVLNYLEYFDIKIPDKLLTEKINEFIQNSNPLNRFIKGGDMNV